METLTHLSLFSGYGGADLGLKLWGELAGVDVRTVCYVEIEEYCQRILQARIADGCLDDAPIWNDVRSFTKRNNACRRFLRELAQIGNKVIISAGFPCQDISCAGKGAGLKGERSGLFYEIIRLAGEIRPRFLLLENVSALYVRGLDRVLGALAEAGYDARWTSVRASDVGAPHRRERWFCLAYKHGERFYGKPIRLRQRQPQCDYPETARSSEGRELADAAGTRQAQGRPEARGAVWDEARGPKPERRDGTMGNPAPVGMEGLRAEGEQVAEALAGLRLPDGGSHREHLWPLGYGPEQHDWEPPRLVANARCRKQGQCGNTDKVFDRGNCEKKPTGSACGSDGDNQEGADRPTEPGLGRNAHGTACRVDRLRALGNGIVPQQLAAALIELFTEAGGVT